LAANCTESGTIILLSYVAPKHISLKARMKMKTFSDRSGQENFGPKRTWKKRYNEKEHNLFSVLNVVGWLKQRMGGGRVL
jgi:hypothetical protein